MNWVVTGGLAYGAWYVYKNHYTGEDAGPSDDPGAPPPPGVGGRPAYPPGVPIDKGKPPKNNYCGGYNWFDVGADGASLSNWDKCSSPGIITSDPPEKIWTQAEKEKVIDWTNQGVDQLGPFLGSIDTAIGNLLSGGGATREQDPAREEDDLPPPSTNPLEGAANAAGSFLGGLGGAINWG